MKKIGAALFATVLAAALPVAVSAQGAPAATDDGAANLQEARAILAIMFPPDRRDQMFDAILKQVAAQMERAVPSKESSLADAGADAIMARFRAETTEDATRLIRAHLPDIIEANARAYTHQFSLDELRQIHAFAQTPAGRHYMSRAANLVNDPAYVSATSALADDTRKVLGERLTKLRADLKAYYEAHPDAAKKADAAIANAK